MKNRKLNIIRNNKTYITYTILFCAISFIIFAIFIKEQKGFIWSGDGFKQHYVFLYDFNQTIRNLFNEGFSMLSWNMGLGLDVIGQYSYYVIGDPFVYISLLFPMEHLETVYSFLIILRMYAIGLAFIAYCKYHKKGKMATLIGAILYTFCGFILYAGIRHPYFANAAIFLPLNFIGIDKLLKENKKAYLIFVVFISAISNYYFFYMITIINIIYAIFKYIFEYNSGIKDFLKKAFNALICYMIGIAMAAVVLLPTVYAFLNSARTIWEQERIYIPGYYSYLFMGLICMRFKNWSVISVASIIIPMIPVLFTKIKQKEAKTYAGVLIVTTIMLLTPFISSMMNGFSFPSNRWVFAYSFVLSYIVTMCLNRKLRYTKKQLISMSIITAIYCIIGVVITKFKIRSNLDFYASMGIAVFILIIILLNNINKQSLVLIKKCSNVILVWLVIINIWVISLALYSNKGKGYVEEFLDNNSVDEKFATLNGQIDNFKEAIEYIKENDTGFYRIAKNDNTYQNTSLLYDYNSIQTYVSIGNGNVYELSCGLEDNCYTATRCVNGMDRRTKITTLLSTKYYICRQGDGSYVPYGYEIYKVIGDAAIYINKYFTSVGVVYDSYILEDKYDSLSPLQKEDVLITTAVLEEEQEGVNKEKELLNNINEVAKLSYEEKENHIKGNEINITKKNQNIYLKIDELKEDTEIYLSIKNLKYDSVNTKTEFKITATFNGAKGSEQVKDYVSSAYYIKNPDFLINLGTVKDNTNNELKITFNNLGKYSFDSIEILEVSMKEYIDKIEILRERQMQDVEYGKDYISGKVNIDTNGIIQIATSYSDGWKAYVDGNETEVIKVNKGFIGTKLEAGEHEVRFEYKTPYINTGIILSALGFILFALINLKERKKLTRKNKINILNKKRKEE